MTTLKGLMDLRGRRALITGAAGGLGRVMADTLAELGADLVLVDRPGCDLGPLVEDLQAKWSIVTLALVCDLEIEDQRRALIETVKADGRGLNSLINNAAFVGDSNLQGWVGSFEEQTLDTWRRAMEVNLTAAFHLSQAFTPELRAACGGNIINISSIYGEYGPDWRLYEGATMGTTMGNPAAYAASKGGLIQLTRWLATTLAPDVRVNAISPGGVLRNQPEAFVRRYEDKTPLKRMAIEEDFRGAIAYLASDMSRYVTGQNLWVDGGWGAW
ncbi:NAD(P)-dependent dehydrogenase, short-chain alcohol dehydrogenase family [Ectothiorhodosinus mongolicus]|uniref:NAD(P)-dependent dehydrogenase, short-chain alcohol dehydrogenase family n=1 Tax=Ectothiorhodosinus mongolicus TaxID=233100 RepID=A0A1R3VTU6_9GAMM|nr:SDR family oxidoreductase [Ectothiorhodosinus mongolicus]ULX56798.1 short-chain dehydrogenase [Ectothiorhodosinus mongolicus]SIT68364.1 NAD(P)-dependent dehydrogenase, short-chain alcohol dehydrogenase family [Ectothiorhodosinus mongolicus]